MTTYVRDICGNCGNLRSECSDPEKAVYPQRTMCYVTAVRELTIRQASKKYSTEPGTAELHPTDGMVIWASHEDLSPDDHFV